MDEKWIRNLEERASMEAQRESSRAAYGPVRSPERVDMNDDESRMIRQALLESERQKWRANAESDGSVILWLFWSLVVALIIVGTQAYLIVNAQRIFGC